MGRRPDFVILGGGIIGLTTAYYLARQHASVFVLDQGDLGREASWAGAGMIPAAPSPERARTPLQRLLTLSNSLFPHLSEELRELTAADNGYVARGALEVVGEEEEALLGRWRDEGIDFEELRGAALLEFEPALSPGLARAFFRPGSAQVRNPRHLKALQAACGRFDVALLPTCPATGFELRGSRVTAVQTPTGPIPAGAFLVAAGSWTDGLLAPLGCRLGVRPVRGQMVLLNARPALFTRVVQQGKRYLVPRPDGRVLVGATEEEGGFDKRTTARAVAELLGFACGLVPELAGAQVERCWAGLRPGSPDGLPFLGPVPGFDNLFVAAGHFRAGIQLSPATGLVMSDLLLGRTPAVPLEAFRLDRSAFRK
jgi:glycine oxidase